MEMIPGTMYRKRLLGFVFPLIYSLIKQFLIFIVVLAGMLLNQSSSVAACSKTLAIYCTTLLTGYEQSHDLSSHKIKTIFHS